jgi:ankyrin repeat protein
MLRISEEPHVLVNEIGNDGRAALHTAVEAMDFKTAKLLIDYGAFVNAQDMAGDTPLHLSTDAQMTTLLLEHGKANPNIPNLEGICVLHSVVQRMDIDSVRLLLTYHAKVDTADNLRWFTPLHLATLPASGNGQSVGNARITMVELLCSVDAPDLNSQDSEGNTPLHYAVQIESQEADSVIRTLLEKGASPRITNSRNQGPLLLLCHNSALRQHDIFQDCLHTMLLHGANPNDQSRTGATPLHLCLYNKDVDGAVQLVRRAAELHLTWQKVRIRMNL